MHADARPHHDPGAAPPGLVTLDDVDHLLSWHLLPAPEIAYLARDGIVVPPARYTRVGASQHSAADAPGVTWRLTTLDVDRVVEELVDGATLSITSVQRQLPAVEAILRDLSSRHTVECSANLYLSGPGARGGLHHDLHDVLALQLVGTKRWQLHEPPAGWHDPATIGTAGEESDRYELRAGDALHVPAGWPHVVTTVDDGWSLHLAVAMRPLTLDRLGVDDVVRARGTAGAIDGDALSDGTRFADALSQRWSAERQLPDEPTTLEALRARAVGAVHRSGPPAGRLLAAAGAFELEPSARVVPRGVPWTGRRTADALTLHAAGRSLRLPPGTEAVLAPLLEGRPLAVADLVDALDVEGATALVRALTAAGFVRSEGPDDARGGRPGRGVRP